MRTEVITVSTKGQVVLPAPMRKELNIKAGDYLAAYATDEAIVLKPIELPATVEFQSWLEKVQPCMREIEKVFSEYTNA